MTDTFSLGDRMKRYEDVSRHYLMRRTPVILRIDGKAFHSYTRHAAWRDLEPFSDNLRNCMMAGANRLIKTMQGVRFAYAQSDEVSFLLTDWRRLSTEAWLKYGIQKMCSISASAFTGAFNLAAATHHVDRPAEFDARVFNLPFEEVTNYFVWRQQDATRNSIQMLGQHHFSHKQLHQKSGPAIHDMLMGEGVNWNDVPACNKRGWCISSAISNEGRIAFETDLVPPIFTQEREYIERCLVFPDEPT